MEASFLYNSVQFSSVTQLCPTLCDPVNCSTPGLPVHHQLPEFTQTHIHQVSDAIQPSHPLSSPSPPAPNPSQHESFPMSQLFARGGQSTGVSALESFLPKKTQDWSPLEWTGDQLGKWKEKLWKDEKAVPPSNTYLHQIKTIRINHRWARIFYSFQINTVDPQLFTCTWAYKILRKFCLSKFGKHSQS